MTKPVPQVIALNGFVIEDYKNKTMKMHAFSLESVEVGLVGGNCQLGHVMYFFFSPLTADTQG